MVNDRLTQLSSSENEFDRAAPMYHKALHESGYDIYLKYRKEAKATKTISNRRKRNIVWFNPPYSENVETNIGDEFLNLITKHFPKHHRLHKICNKNNTKISYSCMPNMSAVILRHNKKLEFRVCLNLGFSGHATIALVLWIHCFHLHVLTSDVVSLLPFLDSISLIIIVVQCRV